MWTVRFQLQTLFEPRVHKSVLQDANIDVNIVLSVLKTWDVLCVNTLNQMLLGVVEHLLFVLDRASHVMCIMTYDWWGVCCHGEVRWTFDGEQREL